MLLLWDEELRRHETWCEFCGQIFPWRPPDTLSRDGKRDIVSIRAVTFVPSCGYLCSSCLALRMIEKYSMDKAIYESLIPGFQILCQEKSSPANPCQ